MIFKQILWTTHSKFKMKQYRFSEKRVLRILRKPDRIEKGIVPKTIANMQIVGTKKNPTEVWMMYQMIKAKVRIISAWRYPGRTKKGEKPIIPEDTLNELVDILKK